MIVRSQVVGCGAYLPQQVVTNAELACRLETSDEWITPAHGHPPAPYRGRRRD